MRSKMHSATCWVTANSLAGSDKRVSHTSQGRLGHMLAGLYKSQVQKKAHRGFFFFFFF